MLYLTIALVVAVVFAGWLAWRHVRLMRRLKAYAAALRGSGADAAAAVGPLADVADAVGALTRERELQLARANEISASLAAVLDQLTDGVLMVNGDARVTYSNAAAERMFGGGLAGRSVTEALRQHQLVDVWQRSRETGQLQSETVEIAARRQFLQLIAVPDQQDPDQSLLLVQDLTRLRRLETVRRDFISNLSHELRTPVASLKALTETLLLGALDDPPAARHFLEQVNVELDALAQMVNELVQLSQIESGQVSLNLRPGSVRELMLSAARRMQLQADRARLTLRVDSQSELPVVRMDVARLEQVLVNLIHNAVKFTPPGGEIVLTAETVPGAMLFAVRDTGIGIPPEDLPRIFERFFKTDRSRAGGGTGLGLSIARHIVESHGGKIWAESIEGKGSTFFLTIPLEAEPT